MDSAVIYHGDALEVMRGLPESSVDLVVTDPPYYRVKNLAWDRAWRTREEFVAWVGELCEQWQRILRPNGTLYVFMGSKMAARVEVEMGRWFEVLSRIVWAKPTWGSPHTPGRAAKDALRCYFPWCDYLLFAEQQGADGYAMGEAGYTAACDKARGFVFEPLRAYLDGERRRAGVGKADCNVACGFSHSPGGMASRHYFSSSQWCLPTAQHYAALRALFNAHGGDYLRREYEDLRREYEDLRREYEDLRRPFTVTPDVPYTDVWTTFPTVQGRPGKHPCEKPLTMLEHIITASSRSGAVVLDCFAGSAATGVAALSLGREFIGIEADELWVQRGRERLAAVQVQDDLFAAAAG